jgi:hypothetical protein
MPIKFKSESLKGRDHLEDQGVDDNVRIELIIEEQSGWVWTHSGNEPSCTIKGGEFLDKLSDC